MFIVCTVFHHMDVSHLTCFELFLVGLWVVFHFFSIVVNNAVVNSSVNEAFLFLQSDFLKRYFSGHF